MDNHCKLKPNLKQYIFLFEEVFNGNEEWKVGIYVRLSKGDKNSTSLSIINQIKKIARFLKSLEDYVVVDIYIDEGTTGTDFNRSDYLRLKKDVFEKQINCIIVKDLTRYSRNLAEGIKELDNYVLKNNIRFISVGIPEIDTYKDPAIISSSEVYQVLSAAEDFARATSKRVRDIKEIKREAGQKNGGFPPYGYLPNPDGEHWKYDPIAGEVKKQMYLWSMAGMSDREIAKRLNSSGILNPTAYKKQIGLKYYNPNSKTNSGLWWPSTVKHILEDKTNIGCSVQGKSSSFDHKRHKQVRLKKEEYIIVPDCHEKTVTNEVFETVANIRSKRTRVSKNTGRVHMFANLVYCFDCKKSMKKTSSKGIEYLVCRTYKDAGKENCDYKSISIKDLKNIVLKVIQYQIMLVTNFQEILKEAKRGQPENIRLYKMGQLIDASKQDISNLENIIDTSYYDLRAGEMSKEQYYRIKEKTENKIERLKESLESLLKSEEKLSKDSHTNNKYFDTLEKNKNIKEIDRLILLELIDKIYINKDKSIEIEFNFADQYLLFKNYINSSINKIYK